MPMDPEQIDAMKSWLAVARKQPMNFGLCIGKQPQSTVLVMHRTKNPDSLGLQAKKEGDTGRIAVGTLEVQGKVLTLRCEGDPPAGLAKRTKQFLKSVDLKMNVCVADADGNILEEDREEDDDPGEPDAAGDGAAPGTEQPGDAPADADQLKWDAARGRFAAAVASAVQRGTGAVDKISAVWNFAVGKADTGNFAAALSALRPLGELLQAAAAPAMAEPAPSAADPDAARWAAAKEVLAPLVAAALQAGGPGSDRIGAAWTLALTRADAGDVQTALKASQALVAALRQLSGPVTGSLNRLAQLRGEWLVVRAAAVRGVGRLKQAIVDLYDGFPGVEQDLAAAQMRLDAIFATLGPDLDNQLARVIAETDATRRAPLVDAARSTLRAHAAFVMGDPVFKEIDGNEVMPSIWVADPIRQKLAEVTATISSL